MFPTALRDDRVSQEVIQAKALLNELACTVSLPVDTLSLVTTRRFEDVETCVRQRQIDLIIAGHHNRLLGRPLLTLAGVHQPLKPGRADQAPALAQGGLQQRKTVFNKRGQRLRAAHQGHCAGERRLLQVGDPERRVLQMGGVQRRQNRHR
ncbi:universal stress family protein [Klebsiella pneumoniae]|nr:universal stress family protein [Klebsiella pneumoniae]